MDAVLKRSRRHPRRALAPERVEQAIDRNDLAGVERKEGEQRPLLGSRQRHGAVVDDRLDRAEDADLDLRRTCSYTVGRPAVAPGQPADLGYPSPSSPAP